MLSKIRSCGLMGIDGYTVEIETDISNGIPGFEIVGLADVAVKESKERVRSAIKNSGMEFPLRKITVNMAPANQRKEGSAYDLPIALGILAATDQIQAETEEYMFVGELSLDGELKPVNGALSMAISARKAGYKYLVLPEANGEEAAIVQGLIVLSAANINEVVMHLNGEKELFPRRVDIESIFATIESSMVDFRDVKGQANVKRALEVAASGAHNCLMIGSPGSGKTMLAKRLPTILPSMTFEEALEVTKIHSIAGLLPPKTPLITTRPFRSPHHTISAIGLVGGGKYPKPGEASLAHHGVLFLDELPEFGKDALEVLRQPLEDGCVTIARVNATLTYPSGMMLIAAANPCKCGFYMDPAKPCTCTQNQVQQYMGKLSGPLLDRIDIHIEVAPVKYKDLESQNREETSQDIRERVNKARKLQQERYREFGIYSNSQLTPSLIERFCIMDQPCKEILRNAFEKLGLSARAHNRILKVSRTLADMDQSETIRPHHLAEAIQYRSLDRKIWK